MQQLGGYRQAQDINKLFKSIKYYIAVIYDLLTELLSPVYNLELKRSDNLLISHGLYTGAPDSL